MKTVIIKAKYKNAISAAVRVLKKGGIIIYPTETSYGIGADAANSDAIKKIFRIKIREKGKQISIIVSSLSMAKEYAVIGILTKKLAQKFMPGPLTLISKKKNLPGILSKNTIAWRIPSHAFALALVKKFGKPITATSANKSGKPQMYKINNVIKSFPGSVDLIIDAGNLPRQRPSTIFDTINQKIVRKGPIKEKDISACLKD
ncbi:MAG: threonylcarbamoyl-AMP synthase [Candidatus Aenigmarchaeota archaeon]|nr:threonylcarbamoyl-AMP synthase [Candidatus Aenigmarchaeota archaeon]